MIGAAGPDVPAVRVALLVEDDPAMRDEALAALATLAPEEVRVAASLAEARRLTRLPALDLAVVDVGLPDGSGLTLVRELAEVAPAAVRVVRTVFDDDATLLGALAAGAQGYLLKGEPLPVLRERLAAAARGEPVVSPAIARRVLAAFRDGAPAEPAPAPRPAPRAPALTARETETLAAIARGRTVAEAAAALGVSPNTVKSHLKSAYAKLDVGTRAAAVHAVQRLGLLDRD